MANGLCESLQSLDVENVFVYVGDAVRWDYLPDEISSEGAVIKTVAASVHSPPSFASLSTGLYPPTHGVSSFSNQVHPNIPTLFDLDGYETRFLNSVREQSHDVDPIYSVLREQPPDVTNPFKNLPSPFVVMERGPGGHAPYGDFDGTAWEYFQNRRESQINLIQSEYGQAVKADAVTFQERLNDLEDAGLTEDTLVIYTSDHGELLGEGGGLGHNEPMRPELVYVPTVFIHPDIDSQTVSGRHFRHVDVVPTITSILSAPLEGELDGRAATDGLSEEPGLTFYDSSFLPDAIPFLDGNLCYEGAWDAAGGYMFAKSGRSDRLAVLFGKSVKSAKRGYLRRNIARAAKSYWTDEKAFGQPDFERDQATAQLQEVRERKIATTEVKLTDDAEDQLHDLGYL
ncbi:sulfatase-like hydrolase/transferase [Halorussus limi]|uniref:Sulfatase-like hydrolase/transferase n=1 Tax=Halorussus limi TaxID=2938695 RepID=A0A8U0HWF2_9EURY|nr:sulfatase-like hydrolase/transferase [Halorussus limi]UPV75248.1 sulfatase-like hydrolase/transferase [Halorussus limi]